MFVKCWSAPKSALCVKRADSQELAQTCKNISRVNRKSFFHCRVFRAEWTTKAGQSALAVSLKKERIIRLQLHSLGKRKEPPSGHETVGSMGREVQERRGEASP